MTHEEKVQWMIQWAHKNKVRLELEGEVGFGRECVGILCGDNFPDYEWYNGDDYSKRADNNGKVWTPEDAYHKHTCVAVLGRGEPAEAQLYEWLKWFDDNGFKIVSVPRDTRGMHPIQLMISGIEHHRMERAA